MDRRPNADFTPMTVAGPPSQASSSRIDLARTSPFTLGPLEVRPATREVRGAGGLCVVAEPRVLQVLVALAEADGATVSRDELVQRCWEGRAVGEDAIQRGVARARRLAELTEPPAFAIESIARVGYRLIRTRDAAPAAAAAPAEPTSAVSRRAALWTGAAVGGAGLLGVAGYAAWRARPSGAPAAAAAPLIAVLPFDNLSADVSLAYFADGLAEDILNALVRVEGLRVAARASSFSFRGPGKAHAAAALWAGYLLDGSVLREGPRLRVNAHLSDVRTQQTLWSETYDRDVSHGLQVEDEVAERVAGALKLRLVRSAGERLIDPEVFDLYLKGRSGNRVHDLATLREAREKLREVVRRAPDFAAAWFELAKNAWRSTFLEDPQTQRTTTVEGRAAARRALSLDPRNGAAWGVLATLSPFFDRWSDAEALMRRGLALSPNDPLLLTDYAWLLFSSGRLGEAELFTARAQSLDPLEVFAHTQLLTILDYRGRSASAFPIADRMQAIWPDTLSAFWGRIWTLVAAERFADAAQAVMRTGHRPPEATDECAVLAQVFRAIASGSTVSRRAAADAELRLGQLGTGYAQIAMFLVARLGFPEDALRVARSLYLRRGDYRIDRSHQFLGAGRYPRYDEGQSAFLFHPFLRPMRRAGVLDEVFSGIGLTDFWRTHPPDPA